MHAPAVDFRDNKRPYSYTKRIMRIFDGHRIDFITGHRHRHATVDIEKGVVEHNVAQVNGNLWYAPICSDGTPRSVFCIEERNGEWTWQHRLLGKSADDCLITWSKGEVEDNEDYIVVKVIGWDSRWSVEWYEDGVSRGAMEQIAILDHDYLQYVENEANYKPKYMKRLMRSAHRHSHYYRCKPTTPNSNITITATDRFGRVYTAEI
jgi:hypothetical protein